jgi:hypothetical protein
MQQFIAKYQDQIEGSLCGLDRIVLSGTLRRVSHAKGMDTDLCLNQIPLKDLCRTGDREAQACSAEKSRRHEPDCPLPAVESDQ